MPAGQFDADGHLLNADCGDRRTGQHRGPGALRGLLPQSRSARPSGRAAGGSGRGDLAYRDTDGWYYFAGRSHDRMRVDSENFTAAPIERILSGIRVRGAAVYAVPDPDGGDAVMAALELHDGAAFDPDDFAAFLAAQTDLGPKWIPRLVRLIPQIPLTGSNKVRKMPLRQERWTTTDPVWWRADTRTTELERDDRRPTRTPSTPGSPRAAAKPRCAEVD